MVTDEPALDIEAIIRTAGIVHAPAIVFGRTGQSTVIDDGLMRLELVEERDGWRWLRGGEEQGRIEDLGHLTRLLAKVAEVYEQAPRQRRTTAEQRVHELYVQWLDEADDMPVPRPWGMCAPGRPLEGPRRRQLVLYDADQTLTSGHVMAEAERLHPDAHVSFERGVPTLIDDGLSWLLFFEWWDGWRYSLDGVDCGRVEDHLDLQVILAARADAYAVASEDERQRAAEHVAELARLPFAERYQRAREHAVARGACVLSAAG